MLHSFNMCLGELNIKKNKNKRNFQLKLPAWYVQHDKINGQTDKLKIKSDRSYTR